MKFHLKSLLIVLTFLAGIAAAQETANTNRATELKAEPKAESATLAPLAEGALVKVIGRSSGWTKVEAEAKAGWVRAFHLRFQSTVAAATESGGAGSALLGSLFGGGQKKEASTKSATLGVRGLSTEELKSASPNVEALKKLLALKAEPPAAERYAKEGKLAATSVAYVGEGGAK